MRNRHVWDHDADHVQASLDRVYYTYTRGNASRQNIDSMVRNLDQFVRQTNEPIGYVFHVVAGAKPPSDEDRERVTQMFNKHGTRLLGVAVVVEAAGFSGAMLRGAVAMVFTLTRKGFQSKTFEDTAGAAGWISTLAGGSPSELQLFMNQARGIVLEGRQADW